MYFFRHTVKIILVCLLFLTSCSTAYRKTAETFIEVLNAIAETPKILIINFVDIIQGVLLYQEKNKEWPLDKDSLNSFLVKEKIKVDFNKFSYIQFVPQSPKRLNIRYDVRINSSLKEGYYLKSYSGIIGIFAPDPDKSIINNNYIEIYIMKVVYSEKSYVDLFMKKGSPFIVIYIKNFNRLEDLHTEKMVLSEKQSHFYMIDKH